MSAPATPELYVTGIHEVLWGGLLAAITLAMHGFGMLLTLRVCTAVKERFQHSQSLTFGLCIIILASWMIILVHLTEVFVWAGFFIWKSAVAADHANASLAYYFALLDYTTLGSSYNLKLNWRLLEGMIAIAGLLTFAWSTGVLLTLAQDFQDQQMQLIRQRRSKSRPHHQSAIEPQSDTVKRS